MRAALIPALFFVVGCYSTQTAKPTLPDEERYCRGLQISEQEHQQRRVDYDAAVRRQGRAWVCLDHLLETAILNYRAAGGTE